MSKGSRNYCFTLNNYTKEEVENMKTVDVKYIVFGKEKGKEGTKHLQGYVEFKDQKTLSAVKKFFKTDRIHLEERKGTPAEASEYCKKDGKYYEKGKISEQGKRNDLIEIMEDLKLKKPMVELVEKYPSTMMRYNKGIQFIRNTLMIDRTEAPTAYWFYGKAGRGKTYKAKGLGKTYYVKDCTQWWDGYEQEEVIIIDDFSGKWPFRDLLRLFDENKYQGQIKGGYTKINSPIIVITCDRHPKELYQGILNDNEIEQLLSRFDIIEEIKGDNQRLKKKGTQLTKSENSSKDISPDVGGNTSAQKKMKNKITISSEKNRSPLDEGIENLIEFEF